MVVNANSGYSTHVVQKNESLWKIAQKELNTKDKNKIANYVDEIVKLNKKIKNPNTIFVNDKILLPDVNSSALAQNSSQANRPVATATSAKTKVPAQVQKSQSGVKTASSVPSVSVKQSVRTASKTNAEKGFDRFIRGISDGNLTIEKAELGDFIHDGLYHVYAKDDKGKNKLIGSCATDKYGKFKRLDFDGENKINYFGYDYILTADGKIYSHSDYDLYGKNKSKLQGKVPLETLNQIISKLKSEMVK